MNAATDHTGGRTGAKVRCAVLGHRRDRRVRPHEPVRVTCRRCGHAVVGHESGISLEESTSADRRVPQCDEGVRATMEGAPGGGAVRTVRLFRRRAVAWPALSLLVLLGACTSAEPAPPAAAPATAAPTSSPAPLEVEQDLVVDGHHFK